MSKADVLLQKATAFERLSLYSDRKTFLQRIAQDATVQQFPAGSGAGINAPMVPTEPPAVKEEPQLMSGKLAPMNAPAFKEQQAPQAAQKNYGDPKTVELLQIFLSNAVGMDAVGKIDGK